MNYIVKSQDVINLHSLQYILIIVVVSLSTCHFYVGIFIVKQEPRSIEYIYSARGRWSRAYRVILHTCTRNLKTFGNKYSSGDEIANVNFLRRYGTYVLQNTKKENLLRLTN